MCARLLWLGCAALFGGAVIFAQAPKPVDTKAAAAPTKPVPSEDTPAKAHELRLEPK